MSELFRAFAARSPTRLFGQVGVFTNLRLVGVVFASVALQFGLHQIPALVRLFDLPDLSAPHWAVAFVLGLVPVSALELAKVARRAR